MRLAVFDDGNGPALYGCYESSGPCIAKWDGSAWSDVGRGVTGFDYLTGRGSGARHGHLEDLHLRCYLEAADCNADGAVNVFDSDPFVEALLGR